MTINSPSVIREHKLNILEIIKIVIGALTPIVVAIVGWFISSRLKKLDLVQWSNQKLIEKRLEIYDSIAPLLNDFLCFYTWVGDWKDISPELIIKAKRQLDKKINIYRFLFAENVYQAYQSFISLLFETYTAPGENAKIRSHIQSLDGNRISDCTYEWKPEWSDVFSKKNIEDKNAVRKAYLHLMDELRISLGITR